MKFKSDIEVQAGLRDGGNDIGTAGQILSSTGSQTNWIDQSSIVASEAKLVFIECKNTSGGTISKGTPVYQTGTVGATDVIEVDAADASDEDKMAAIGLLQTDLANNAFGKVVITGELLNITTSPIDGVTPVTGDTIYVKSGGGLTLTKPTGVNFIQNIGLVGKVSGGSAGSITVSSIMRSNDVPTPLYIDHTNQRLGIGIETPDSTLHVASPSTLASQSTILKIENTADQGSSQDIHIYNQYDRDIGIKFETLGGTNYIWQDSNGDDALILSSGGNNRANDSTLILEQDHDVLIPNGNVGIGVSPSTTLHVGGFARINGGLQMNATNATIYQILDSDLRFGTNNTERMRIDNTGNVGIGTTAPDAKLHVNSENSQGTLIISRGGNNLAATNNVGSITFPADYNGTPINYAQIKAYANALSAVRGSLDFSVKSTSGTVLTGMTVYGTSSGVNVGIGTTSPGHKLEVYATGDSLSIGDNSNTQTYMRFANSRTMVGYGGANAVIQAGSGKGINFNVNNDSFNSGTAATITSTGNVGIGTTSPSQKLEVDGAVKVTNTFTGETSANSGYFDFISTTSTARITTKGSDGSTLGKFQILQQASDGSPNNTPFYIDSDSNVGIGTTSPSEKLDVAGNIKIQAALLSNQENTDIDSAAAEVVAQVAISYTAAFFDFVVKKGTNVRSGTVYACHDGTNVEFTETSTNDLGDTSDVTLSVDKTSTNLRLIATVTSDDWSVKSLIRAI